MLDFRKLGDWERFDTHNPPVAWIDKGGAQHYRIHSPEWFQHFGEKPKFSPGDVVRLTKDVSVLHLRKGQTFKVSRYESEMSAGRFLWGEEKGRFGETFLLEHELELVKS